MNAIDVAPSEAEIMQAIYKLGFRWNIKYLLWLMGTTAEYLYSWTGHVAILVIILYMVGIIGLS